MKHKPLETLLYSAVGVAAMFAVIAGFNLVTAPVKVRVDLTADRAHTLSEGTRAILEKLDATVKIRFYCTQAENATAESVYFGNYARQVEDLLDEFRQQARGKVVVEKFDPQPDSDAEDSARLDGIEGQPLPPYGENFYLGLTVSVLDERASIPFLAPNRERLLEYDVARAITQVMTPQRPILGVLSALPVFGMPMNPMMMQMGRQGQEPWILISELKRDFDVREVQTTAERIDDDIQVLVVIHPRDLSDAAQYAIDQFVLRGGRLVAFVDPLSFADNRSSGMNPLQRATASGSTLDKLFKAWGVEFDVGKCVSDMSYKTALPRNNRLEDAPTVLSLTRTAMASDDVVTGQLDNILLPYAGAFTGSVAPGLQKTVLFRSSTNAMLVDKVMAEFTGGNDKDFKPAGTEYALALRLTGKFKTAFPDGKPGADASATNNAAATNAPSAGDSLKESKTETTVVLIGDSDVLYDPVMGQTQNFLGQRLFMPQNGNLSFAQSTIEFLGGDSRLIAVRSRASLNRPFTRVKEMEEKAQSAYRNEIRDLENSLQETQQKLNELQRTKKESQRLVLSAEQQQEIANFRQREAEMKKKLKQVRRSLRQDVDKLQNRLKFINIAGMPVAVIAAGIAVATYKRKKTAAK